MMVVEEPGEELVALLALSLSGGSRLASLQPTNTAREKLVRSKSSSARGVSTRPTNPLNASLLAPLLSVRRSARSHDAARQARRLALKQSQWKKQRGRAGELADDD